MHSSFHGPAAAAILLMQLVATFAAGRAWLAPFGAATALAADVVTQGREDPDGPPYAVEGVYTADAWRNASGGLRTGGTYLDNFDLTFAVDGARAWGIRGLSAYAHVLYNNSTRFSERYVGDAMTVSNIDAPRAVRLYEAWMEWVSGTAWPWSLRFGLYDLNTEFDMSETRSLFIHSTHGIGHELGQTGENGPSIFPNTSLGLRAAWEPADNWRLLVAVMDGVPGDPQDPTRTRIHLSGEEGALGIAEAQWSGGRVSKLSVGRWHYTARFTDVLSTSEAPLPRRRDNEGTYAVLDVALDRTHAGGAPRASTFVRYGVAEGRINEFDRFLGAGVRFSGAIRTRPEDELGIAFSHARVSAATRNVAAASAAPRDGYEAALELTWRATINEWFAVQPDIQYIFNPGADPALADALALGVRFEFSLLAAR